MFGSGSSTAAGVAAGEAQPGPELILTSSSSSTGLVGQEGAERTSVDISQLAGDKEVAGQQLVPGISQPTSPELSTDGGLLMS